jgi:hypothetical protein
MRRPMSNRFFLISEKPQQPAACAQWGTHEGGKQVRQDGLLVEATIQAVLPRKGSQ